MISSLFLTLSLMTRAIRGMLANLCQKLLTHVRIPLNSSRGECHSSKKATILQKAASPP